MATTEDHCRDGAPCKRDEAPCKGDETPWWMDKSNLQAARQYVHLNGHLYSHIAPDNAAVNGPLTLQACDFPQELYENIYALQPAFNSLLDAVSRNLGFLEEALAGVLKVDDFTCKLFKLLKDSQPSITKTAMDIFRADYMMNYKKGAASEVPSLTMKQTEMNTFCTATMTQGDIHEYYQYIHSRYDGQSKPLNIPVNGSSTRVPVVDGLAAAWKQYGQPDARLLFVTVSADWNMYDFRTLEFDLWNRYRVKAIYRTFQELGTEAELRNNQELFVSDLEVAVVYYRTGYGPKHYSSEKDWSTRLLLERSRAVCCPSVAYQLVGTKKVQQVLAAPGVLERFIDDPDTVRKIRSTFTGLYSLDRNPEGDRNLAAALERPNDYVLKCQREGGNNNIYGDEIRTFLESIKSSEEREGYILMDRLRPPTRHCAVLRMISDEPSVYDNMFCEVGIYGVYVRHGDEVLLNEGAGFMVRTKPVTRKRDGPYDESSVLDSLNLIPITEFLAQIAKEE